MWKGQELGVQDTRPQKAPGRRPLPGTASPWDHRRPVLRGPGVAGVKFGFWGEQGGGVRLLTLASRVRALSAH